MGISADKSSTGDDDTRLAAYNNALWCEAMCRSHGIPSAFGAQVWASSTRSPMFYPDAVTLEPAVSAAAVLNSIDLSEPGATIKDSFADLDLSDHAFRILFEAEWIRREPGQASGASPQASDADWARVFNAAGLAEWAQAWDGDDGNADLFRPYLLGERDVCVLAQRSNGHIVAGAIANRSSSVVGISNVFALEGVSQQTWAGLLRAVDLFAPGMPLVGYEHGADLTVALHSGFRAVGPLRIWMQDRS